MKIMIALLLFFSSNAFAEPTRGVIKLSQGRKFVDTNNYEKMLRGINATSSAIDKKLSTYNEGDEICFYGLYIDGTYNLTEIVSCN